MHIISFKSEFKRLLISLSPLVGLTFVSPIAKAEVYHFKVPLLYLYSDNERD